MSKFAEFWPDKVRLLYSDKDLTPEMWPRLVNRAKHTNETIRLRLQRTYELLKVRASESSLTVEVTEINPG